MNREPEFEAEQYVDVRSLPLKPPQPALKPEKAVRRPWHPVMWDNSDAEVLTKDPEMEQKESSRTKEYPHKQRMRNLRRLIAEGKVKPTSETLIFFLCNKFAISEERQSKLKEIDM
ncbi:uncharacterized protein LOC123653538 [Melitaea cinxia]|uniref:uncharacterized protein LOC123653538 n=1 Tax=Melitaea cinxia TaxID=113334 RepID=UPI001E270D6E|nr:uncharacterized protein LOC123653538 [Melitaea cinxia]XP_045445484.1 uncharacterized protein LOC123653538 [Melitaea cinxia]